LTRLGGDTLPWAPLTIREMIRQRKAVVGVVSRGRGGVC
jgi:hypothetical protein